MANFQPRLTPRETTKMGSPSPAKDDLSRYFLDSDRLEGELHGSYGLIGPLGSGGMGSVYLAEHIPSGSLAVVKKSSDQVTNYAIEGEFNALLYFSHPNIVKVHDIGESNGFRFLVIEYLEGKDLEKHLQNKIDPDVAIEITMQVLSALGSVHEAGLIHHDIKPANIFLAESPAETIVKLIDFGLSTTAEDASNNVRSFGTPLYMSPEMVRGEAIDVRSDVYSAGVVLYRMLSGKEPFQGNNAEVMKQTLDSTAPSLENPLIPRDLARIVSCALEKDPKKRFRNAAMFRAALEESLEQMTLHPRHSDVHEICVEDREDKEAIA